MKKNPVRSLSAFVLLLVLAASLACNVSGFGGTAPTATPLRPSETLIPPTEPPEPTVVLPSLTPSDTPVPTLAVTATPSEVTVTAAAEIACRFGPASEYSVEGKLAGGVTTLALARNNSSSWIRIEHQSHPGRNCWIKAEEVSVSGNLASVPVEAAPAAIVAGVHVDLSPSEVTVPGCVFPYTLSVEYSITVSGPTTVKYQLSKDNGDKVSGTQTFTASGTYSFSDHYRLGSVGNHWFQVDVTSPNAMSGRGTSTAVCGP